MDKNNKKVEQHDQKATHNSAMGNMAKNSQNAATASTKTADKECGTDKKGSCSTKATHKQDKGTGCC